MKLKLAKNKFTYIEELVLEQFIIRNRRHSDLIKAQINHAKIESRSISKVGFITNFSIPAHIPTLNSLNANKALEVYADHPDALAGAGFFLWFEDGKLSTLEGYVFIGDWPINELKFRIITKYDSLCGDLVNSKHFTNSTNCFI